MSTTHALSLGEELEKRQIAVLRREGGAPGLFWLGGFMSDMRGTKAEAIDHLAAERGLGMTRFDYSGHGESGGSIEDGTISRWLDEAHAVFMTTRGPQILLASSMGAWLALLLNQRLREQGEDRVQAMVLLAPAVDMTEDLLRKNFTPEQLHDLHHRGRVEQPSQYGPDPYILTERLITDGASHLLFDKGTITTGCPVTIVQGAEDPDVPPAHAIKLLTHLTQDPVTFTLIPGGDHRLSRDEDIEVLERAISAYLDAR